MSFKFIARLMVFSIWLSLPVSGLSHFEVFADTPPAKSDWKLPTPEFRDQMLKKSGLDSKVGDWGSAEKDTLYSTARDSSLKDLEEKYPSLPQARLQSLSKLAKSGSKSKSPTAEGQPKADPDDVIDKVVHLGP